MDVRWVPTDRTVKANLDQPKTKRNRVRRFALVTLSAGAISGVGAMFGIWPFSGLQVLATQLVQAAPANSAIQARTLFPPVPPVHQVVDVYDPPPAVAPAQYPRAPNPEPESGSDQHDDGSPSSGGGDN
jgi:hypothetical protein